MGFSHSGVPPTGHVSDTQKFGRAACAVRGTACAKIGLPANTTDRVPGVAVFGWVSGELKPNGAVLQSNLQKL